jgi:dipeptidyl aminopeptidase/acylaminoacyl peptidase
MPSPAPSGRRRPLAVVAALSLLAGISALAEPAPKRHITETDLFRFVWVADPQISPDGRTVAFVRVAVDAKREGYDTGIWVVPADGGAPPRPFTSGRHDTSPRWSPDGRRLAFLRSDEKGGKDGAKGEAQLYLLSLDGGEARALTALAGGVDSPVWSPDGRTLAFTNGASEKDLARADKGREPEAASAPAPKGKDEDADRESDVRVITRAVYRRNGSGYIDDARPSHLWMVRLPGGEDAAPPRPLQVTRGPFEEQSPAWSPDGKVLYFTSRRVKDTAYERQRRDLYAVASGGGEPRQIVSFDGSMDEIALSRDGRRVAWTGAPNTNPERSYDESDLLVADTAPGSTPRNLTAAFDGDLGGGLTGDQHPPRGGASNAPVWSADGAAIYAVAAVRGRANLLRFDGGSGKPEPVTTGDQEVVAYTAAADGSRFALTIATPTSIGDLFVLDAADRRLRQLTRFNDELFAGLDVTPPEEIVYKSFDGRAIEAWVQKPPGFDPHHKYPLILNIHGGPDAAYGYTFDHEFQWMAAQGYVVLYPNPRGSSTYGEEFGNVIQYRYPGDDAKDLLAGVDELVRRGYADPRRLGVTGGSGGGILTNWIVGHDDRFAAAVAQRSIADWRAFWYAADFSQFTRSWFKGAPWEDPADFAARSPITYVTRIKTPLMLIEGESDYRTPPGAGGEQMFRALKYLKRPVVMVRFPGESHELSRSGKPWHRVERLRHIVGWFDKYLQGKKVDGYDVP